MCVCVDTGVGGGEGVVVEAVPHPQRALPAHTHTHQKKYARAYTRAHARAYTRAHARAFVRERSTLPPPSLPPLLLNHISATVGTEGKLLTSFSCEGMGGGEGGREGGK